MSENTDSMNQWMDEATYAFLKEKLGVNAFKEVGNFHIHIKEDAKRSDRLKAAVLVCPAGLYRLEEDGSVSVSEDGCLECGTCKIACGDDAIEWRYPDAMCGVQYRFG